MEMRKIQLDFYTEYHQFFIRDTESLIDTNDDLWSEQAHKDRLAVSPGFLSVGTACYGPLKGELIILDKQGNLSDFSAYDHVVEGSILCKSGTLEIIPCMSNEPTVSIEILPGFYRVRIYSSGIKTVIGDEGEDYYRIEIWEDNFSERKVLKTV